MQKAVKRRDHVELRNVKFEYHIDYINKRLHLLNIDHRRKISDVIGLDFQAEFIKAEKLLIDILDFDWYLYESQGIIVLYKNSSYFLTSHLMPYLHKDYLNKLAQRGKN